MSRAGILGNVDLDAIHKLPKAWRYFNVSVLWIFYYPLVIRILYSLNIRHEIITLLSIACGVAAAAMIVRAESFSGFMIAILLVHLKDLFDACDGALARLTGTGHRLGRFLDTIGDGVVFTLWIVATAYRGIADGLTTPWVVLWAGATWFSLFLQCSYFNFHQLHYIRLAGVDSASRMDERSEPAHGIVAALAFVYELWFGWQDRLIAAFDRWQRRTKGLPSDSGRSENGDWFGSRPFMVANSALCFGTQAFVLILCLLFQAPFWFLPAITVGLNLYWLGIVLARFVVFRGVA